MRRHRHRWWHKWFKKHRDNFFSYLRFDDMIGATLTVAVGDNTHFAVTTNLNLDSSVATGVSVSYASDNTAVVTVDASTGQIGPVAAGTANVTETSVRGAFTHTDSGAVTVTDPNAGDFTSALTFS